MGVHRRRMSSSFNFDTGIYVRMVVSKVRAEIGGIREGEQSCSWFRGLINSPLGERRKEKGRKGAMSSVGKLKWKG